jgi:hypothetical protein
LPKKESGEQTARRLGKLIDQPFLALAIAIGTIPALSPLPSSNASSPKRLHQRFEQRSRHEHFEFETVLSP